MMALSAAAGRGLRRPDLSAARPVHSCWRVRRS